MTPDDYTALAEILTTAAVMVVVGFPIAVLLPATAIKTIDKRRRQRRQQEGQ